MPPRRRRDDDGEFFGIVAPGVLDLPDELPVTLNWGPHIGTAKLTAGPGGVIASIRFDGPAGAASTTRRSI